MKVHVMFFDPDFAPALKPVPSVCSFTDPPAPLMLPRYSHYLLRTFLLPLLAAFDFLLAFFLLIHDGNYVWVALNNKLRAILYSIVYIMHSSSTALTTHIVKHALHI